MWWRTESTKSEVIAHEWMTLKLLWETCRAAVSDPQERDEIDKLFARQPTWNSKAQDWFDLNYAEQRVGAHLDPARLATEYQNLLERASTRKLASLSLHQKRVEAFSDATQPPPSIEQRRAFYASLLYDLQSNFVDSRNRRHLWLGTATWLLIFGAGVLILALLPIAVYYILTWFGPDALGALIVSKSFGSIPSIVLAMVATFGILGAYFSRTLAFQSNLSI